MGFQGRSPYGNHGMMGFNSLSIPPTPFSFYPQMHMTSSAIPGFTGLMGMGGVAPFPKIAENCDITSSEFPEGQQKRRKYTKEDVRRNQSCDDDDDDDEEEEEEEEDWGRQLYNGTTRLQEHRSFDNKENSASDSSNGSAKKSQSQDRYGNKFNDDSIHLVDGHRKGSHLVVSYDEGKWYNKFRNRRYATWIQFAQ